MEENKIIEKVNRAIEDELNAYNECCDASDAETTLDRITKLHKIRMDEEKLRVEVASTEADRVEKRSIRSEEAEAKKKQAVNQRIDLALSLGVQVLLGGLSMVAYNAWLNRGLRFEETGSIRSPMTRNLLSRLIPKSK